MTTLTKPQLQKPSGQTLHPDIVFAGSEITKTYRSRRVQFTLQPLDLQLRLGEITAVVGENGNGKTTLLKIVAGEHVADQGHLRYPAIVPDSRPMDWPAIKQQVAFISQDLPKWHGNVLDNLYFAAASHAVDPAKIDQFIDFIVTSLRLQDYRHARWKELSGGYKMRFALAKALITKPTLLIIDEPLANLDINAQITFLDDLRTFAVAPSAPMAVLITSQHLHEVERIADNMLFMRAGQTLYNGPTHAFATGRTTNTFEIACDTGFAEIGRILQQHSPDSSVRQNGYNYIITTPIALTRDDLMALFVQHAIVPTYFRDISTSTRKLFTEQPHD